jgi:hypothetical protein
MTIKGLISYVFLASLAVFLLGLYKGDTLPPPSGLLSVLASEPVQRPVDRPPFDTTVNDVTYHIKPLYRYELWGLVVSRHHADSFIDYAHQEWGDHLNTVDLCVIWGKNAFSGVYEKAHFSSGQWTCYVEYSAETGARFSWNEMSNNHLLVDRAAIRQQLKRARVGDQIHFRGYLVEYSHDGEFQRGTSTVRDDTGNGACETVFLEDFAILRKGPGLWRNLRWFSGLMLLALTLVWFLMPHRFHFR